MCTGYCSYTNPADSRIPGIENFNGQVIHPQFWPHDYDSTDRHIAVIGSGATAVTLVPEIAKKAAKVTMIQRSPTYIVSQPTINPVAASLNRYLPAWLAWQLARWWSLFVNYTVITGCKKDPAKWTDLLKKAMAKELPSRIPVDPHFTPRYNPWQQRLCLAADGDFFEVLRSGKADVITDTITQVTKSGIELASGDILHVDNIVTATGLRLEMGGGCQLSVDGETVEIGRTFLWRNLMLKDVPNFGLFLGYADQSWTLGVDVGAKMLCRVLKLMKGQNVTIAVPRMTEEETKSMQKVDLLDLTSTYFVRDMGQLPKGGNSQPWRPKKLYVWDWWVARWANIEKGLELTSRM
jgi:cation diffusion facilitator CzcD-associated flavoprotein CzcO